MSIVSINVNLVISNKVTIQYSYLYNLRSVNNVTTAIVKN
jgi:hypothetical protein